MNFTSDYERWLEHHRKMSRGERLRRLNEGLGHAEQLFAEYVWYPAFRSFDHLQPEYEVNDYRDGVRYLDFAYLQNPIQLCIEIDGYGPHWRELNRRQFADQLLRQNHLVIDGWKVLRFAYDDVKDSPRKCQQLLQQFRGKWLGGSDTGNPGLLTPQEKEIIRLAMRKAAAITLADTTTALQTSAKTARKSLRSLVEKDILAPAGGSTRFHKYVLIQRQIDLNI